MPMINPPTIYFDGSPETERLVRLAFDELEVFNVEVVPPGDARASEQLAWWRYPKNILS